MMETQELVVPVYSLSLISIAFLDCYNSCQHYCYLYSYQICTAKLDDDEGGVFLREKEKKTKEKKKERKN